MRIADFVFEAELQPRAAEPPETPLADRSRGATFVSRFAEWTVRRPGVRALIDEAGSTTYRELDAWSNRIAHWLLGCGLPPEAHVGVMAGRDRSFIAAMVGIMKAGCVYVPLDATQPLPRPTPIP